MASAIKSPPDLISFDCCDTESLKSYAIEGASAVYDFAVERLYRLSIGVAAGAVCFCVSVITAEAMITVGLEPLRTVIFPVIADLSSVDLEYDILIGPVVEELIFRGVLQPLFVWWNESQELEPIEFSITEKTQIKLSAIIAIVATSILFGYMHYFNGCGIIPVVTTGLASLIFGFLREVYGIESSISAHMTHNALYTLTCLLLPLLSQTK